MLYHVGMPEIIQKDLNIDPVVHLKTYLTIRNGFVTLKIGYEHSRECRTHVFKVPVSYFEELSDFNLLRWQSMCQNKMINGLV